MGYVIANPKLSTMLPPQKWSKLDKDSDYYHQITLEAINRWNSQELNLAFNSYVWWFNRANTIITRRNWIINFWNPKNAREAEYELKTGEAELEVNLAYLQQRAIDLEEAIQKTVLNHINEFNLAEQITYPKIDLLDISPILKHYELQKNDYYNRITA